MSARRNLGGVGVAALDERVTRGVVERVAARVAQTSRAAVARELDVPVWIVRDRVLGRRSELPYSYGEVMRLADLGLTPDWCAARTAPPDPDGAVLLDPAGATGTQVVVRSVATGEDLGLLRVRMADRAHLAAVVRSAGEMRGIAR